MLKGASLGRAALMARQRYARKTLTLSPVDLKTLAQFLIYGDASTVCVTSKTVGELSMKTLGAEARAVDSEVKQRRAHLLVDGEELQRSRATSFQPLDRTGKRSDQLAELAKNFGIVQPKITSVRVQRKQQAMAMVAGFGKAVEATGISEFHILTDAGQVSKRQSFKLLEIAASNEDIIFVRELFSR